MHPTDPAVDAAARGALTVGFERQLAQLDAYSIPEFCARHGGITRQFYYKLKNQGLGPREMRLGNRVLISREAAARWRAEREAATTEASAVSQQQEAITA